MAPLRSDLQGLPEQPEREQRDPGDGCCEGDDDDHRDGDDDEQGVEPAGAPVAQPHREGRLAALAVGGDVAQVVDHEDRRGDGADPDRAGDADPGQLAACV